MHSDLLPIEKEVRMWRAVLDQAVQDFLNTSDTSEAKRERKKAQIFLRGNSSDFFDVCDLAYVSPDVVRWKINELVGGKDELYKELT